MEQKEQHLAVLQRGVRAWNEWRLQHPDVQPDLQGANLKGAQLSRVDMHHANLSGAVLRAADLRKANLAKARLHDADLARARLNGSTLVGANLRRAYLREADLVGANLQRANLRYAVLVNARLDYANLNGTFVYGVSAWDLSAEHTHQVGLVISRGREPTVTVDDLEVAQFVYVLLNSQKIRTVIDTITTKLVLILGRFTPERKAVLHTIADNTRQFGLIPVIFDFAKPDNRSFIETVSTLAHLAQFVIADCTEPKIVIQELTHIVGTVSVPVLPLFLETSGREPSTLYDLRINHRSLLDTLRYTNAEELACSFEARILRPLLEKSEELRGWRMRATD